MGLVALIAVVCIAAVTLLGKSASSKFSSVGTPINDPALTTPSSSGPGRATSTATAGDGPAVVPPPAPGATITGDTPCPASDGSSTRTTKFAHAPPTCTDPAKTYTATFATNMGTFSIKLDQTKTPVTTNNFVVLARYHFYDGTSLFRIDPSIAIIQGGAAGTNTAADPGPGYTIPDEGGRFTYTAGQLVMARTQAPNSAGAQFFLTTGPEVAALNTFGTYVVFGDVTDGAPALNAIAATYVAFPASSPYAGLGGGPKTPVIINTVTVDES